MPLYYFDFDDGPVADSVGSELPDLAAARAEATDTLALMGRETFGRRPSSELRVSIRSADGTIQLRLLLRYSIEE
jgi:hypothetical protein